MPRLGHGPSAIAEIASRLRARREEIEQAMLARLIALSPVPGRAEPGYAEGLRAAIAAAVEHAIASLESADAVAAVPMPLLAQARLAARSGVGLDTVVRRYVAGHNLIGDFVLQEAADQLPPGDLKRLLRTLSHSVDGLIHAAGAAYTAEYDSLRQGRGRERLATIQRLLRGELIEAEALEYDLSSSHLGIVASGSGAEEALRPLAHSLGARLLVASPAEGVSWAWLGRRRGLDPEEVCDAAESLCPPGAHLALGEAAPGPVGWRLTHRQARAAHGVGPRETAGVVRYADVALVAAIRDDDLLETSLRRLYLDPLEDDCERGEILRQTLRHYLAADCNVSSAAAALGVNRSTVTARLREVEERIGCALERCRTELDVALRLQDPFSSADAIEHRSSAPQAAGSVPTHRAI